jgi:hypothetical protein
MPDIKRLQIAVINSAMPMPQLCGVKFPLFLQERQMTAGLIGKIAKLDRDR